MQEDPEENNNLKRVRPLSLEEIEQALTLNPINNPTSLPQSLKRCCLREGCEDINCYKRLNKIH